MQKVSCKRFSLLYQEVVSAAQFVKGDTTECLLRESKAQKIGVYDMEAGIKPRPEVTHLLNHGNLLIFCLFVLYSLT